MKTDKLLLAGGIVAGAAAGVLIGILLAPDKGEETRKKIIEKGEDKLDAMKDKLEGMITAACRSIESIKNNYVPCNCGENCSCRAKASEPNSAVKQA